MKVKEIRTRFIRRRVLHNQIGPAVYTGESWTHVQTHVRPDGFEKGAVEEKSFFFFGYEESNC